jgi:hypothetical protein
MAHITKKKDEPLVVESKLVLAATKKFAVAASGLGTFFL